MEEGREGREVQEGREGEGEKKKNSNETGQHN